MRNQSAVSYNPNFQLTQAFKGGAVVRAREDLPKIPLSGFHADKAIEKWNEFLSEFPGTGYYSQHPERNEFVIFANDEFVEAYKESLVDVDYNSVETTELFAWKLEAENEIV